MTRMLPNRYQHHRPTLTIWWRVALSLLFLLADEQQYVQSFAFRSSSTSTTFFHHVNFGWTPLSSAASSGGAQSTTRTRTTLLSLSDKIIDLHDDSDDDEEDDDDDDETIDPYTEKASSEFGSSSSSSSSSSALTHDLPSTVLDWGGALGTLRQRLDDLQTPGKAGNPSQALFRYMSADAPNQAIGAFLRQANPQTVQAMSGAVGSLLGGLSSPQSGVEVLVKSTGDKIGSLCFQLQMTGCVCSQ